MIKKISNRLLREIDKWSTLNTVLGRNFIDVVEDLEAFSPRENYKTIVDVGANIGQTSLKLIKKFPGSRIYSFEPVEATYKRLLDNCRQYSSIRCFQTALGGEPGSATVYHQKSPLTNSLIKESSNLAAPTSEVVKIITLDDFAGAEAIERIDFLKTDTEGYDLEVLKGSIGLLENNRIAIVYSEITFVPSDKAHTNFFEINEFLKNYNFHLFGIYEQVRYGPLGRNGHGNALYINPAAFAPEQKADFFLKSASPLI